MFLTILVAAACSKPAPQARPDLVSKGGPAPQLALSGLLNAPVRELKSLEELKDKVVVLEFWATWCEPCVESIPHLNALAEKFRDKPVVFIAVTDETSADVSEFMKRTPVKSWVAPDAPASAFRSYRVFGLPHTVLIGRDLKVAAVTYPTQVTEAVINDMLDGRPPSGEGFSGAAADARK